MNWFTVLEEMDGQKGNMGKADEVMDGGVGVRASARCPSFSFHVVIYSVWLIPFTPAAGAIPLEVQRAPPPSSPCPPLSLSVLLSSSLPRSAHLLGRSPLRTPCGIEETEQACGNHGNRLGQHHTERAQTAKSPGSWSKICRCTFFLLHKNWTQHKNTKNKFLICCFVEENITDFKETDL